MSDILLAELLIFLLLFAVLGRQFFSNKIENDLFVMFSPVSLLALFALVLGQGLSLLISAWIVLAIVVFLLNVGYIIRCASGLKVDQYPIVHSVFSVLFLLCLFTLAYYSFTYRPLKKPVLDSELTVELSEEKLLFTGSHLTDFYPKNRFFDFSNLTLTLVQPKQQSATENTESLKKYPLILFIPDVFASVNDNKATIESLAQKGAIVIAADFYINDSRYANSIFSNRTTRTFYLRSMSFLQKTFVETHKDQWIACKKREIASLYALVEKSKIPGITENSDGRIFCIADGFAAQALAEYRSTNLGAFSNIMLLGQGNNLIPGYVDGFGNLAVYYPLEYSLLTKVKTDGWIQARLIASKMEKLK